MNQNFTAEQLIKLCTHSEFIRYKTTKAKLLADLEIVSSEITDGTFEFKITETSDYYLTEELIDKLVLRKLNDNIKKLYKDEQANRRIIVFQVKTLLEDECPFWVHRTDISGFYESIDRNRLINKIKSDSLLSYFSQGLITKIFSNPILIKKSGLPRGLPISSTLSELYMRPFDKLIRGADNVFYYARFVDDIIIFCNRESKLKTLETAIDNYFVENGFAKNKTKTRTFSGERIFRDRPLEYLGYKFVIHKLKKGKKKLDISIADAKIKKIKSRIIFSFLDFIKTGDAILLENRIKFLTGNYNVKSSFDDRHNLKAGIYYNYIYINTLIDLYKLNVFYQKSLKAKAKSFGSRLSRVLTPTIKAKLEKYSFKHGFDDKSFYKFNPTIMKKINNCWR
jgi:hypothetical protein